MGWGAVALLMTPWLYLAGHPPMPETVLPFVFLFAVGAHFFTAGGAMSIIAGEIQAGTMRLLVLTGMRPRDLVMGQFLAGLGIAGWAAAGLLPWLVVGALFSPMVPENLFWLGMLWLAVGVAANAVMLLIASLGKTVAPGAASGLIPALLLVGRPWLDAFFRPGRPSGAVRWELVRVCLVLGGVALVALLVAGWRLARADRRSAGQTGTSRWGRWLGWGVGGRPGLPERRRLLDGNPIEWLGASRCPWWVWVVVVGGLSCAWWDGAAEISEVFQWACVTRVAVLLLAAFRSFAQVRTDLRDGVWESLLRTPVTVEQYLGGNWVAWWRQQRWPLLAVAVTPGAVALIGGSVWGGEEPWWALVLHGLVITAADAALASLWFFGAAVKCKEHEFYYATVLATFIIGVVQMVHGLAARDAGWPWIWVVIVAVLGWLSFGIIRGEIRTELDTAAGLRRKGSFELWATGGGE